MTVQIIAAEIIGDKVLCAASSSELGKYGLSVGLKNYSAAYCTGLLCARRLLRNLKLEEAYPGVEEVDGQIKSTVVNGRTFFVEELNDDKKPFRCLLDVGIKNTTTGARMFGALKGASDGGLDIPHNHKRFPGYTRDSDVYDAEVHKGHIMGEHVADYMREMEEDDENNFTKHFAKYIENSHTADDLEELYEKVHQAIREDPTRDKAPKFTAIDKTFRKGVKKSLADRKRDSLAKKATFGAGGAGGDMEEEEGDDEEEDA